MRYSFTDCVLDTERCELRRVDEPVRIRPKVLKVLTYLIENRDRVVSKEELFGACWPGRVVGDASLNSCLKQARRAVGDSGDSQHVLKTSHGLGYRFVATVDTGEEAAPEPESDAGADRPPGLSALSDREYKQVSVFACELRAGAASPQDDTDERLDQLLRDFLAGADAVLDRYGGHITEQFDAGFTALFGAPLAQEDHARRAVLAAEELRQLLASLNRDDVPAPDLRIGLHAGSVLAETDATGRPLHAALGRTTAAARTIRDLADKSTLMSKEFLGLVETEVVATPAATYGAEAAVAYALERVAGVHSGVPRRSRPQRSAFVGRDEEMQIAARRLQQALSGTGQVVGLTGEPGIGKSRLLREFAATIRDRSIRMLRAMCLPYRQSTPYFPVLQLVRQACGVERGDPRERVIERVRQTAAAAGVEKETDVELLLYLMDAGPPAERETGDLPRSGLQEGIDLACRIVLHGGAGQPLVILIEDMHWADSTTDEWLKTFVPRIAGAPVLIMLTWRPGYQSDALRHSSVTQLALARLNDADSRRLIESLALEIPETAELKRRIVNYGQGNPFFLEELAFDLAESLRDDRPTVPRTVQAVLASRIDQLDPRDKALLQTAAVIGSPVAGALLDAVIELSPPDLDASIRRLEQAELLFEEHSPTERLYQFKHALTQDVAYESMPQQVRQDCHARIATTCEECLPQAADTQPELLAYHYDRAALPDRALDYWFRAGTRAAQRSANTDAVAHFRNALSVLEQLPDNETLRRRKLDVYMAMGSPLMSTEAFTSPEVERVYLNAREICESQGLRQELFTVLWGLWLHYAHRGLIADARRLADQLMEIARDLGDTDSLLQAHHAGWTVEIWHGDLESCQEHTREGIRLYDRERHQSHRFFYGGHDPGVCALGTAAIAVWFMGEPDEALRLAQAGADLAMALDHPYSRLITNNDLMEVEWLRGRPDRALQYARHTIDMCEQQNVPNYLAVGQIFAGWSTVLCGQHDEGLAELERGIEAYRRFGADRNLASYLLLMADACLRLRLHDKCDAAAEEAGVLAERTGESRWLAEILRIKGELLLARSDQNAARAEQLFVNARDTAADQRCWSFELRSATSLAALMLDGGRKDEAVAVLRPVYERFTEGHDTADLRRARECLDRAD